MRTRFFLLVALLATLGADAALAQAALDVSLFNATTAAPIASATVEVSNEEIGLTRTAQTDAQGKARFAGLPTSGTYTVRALESRDYYEALNSGIVLRANFTRSVTLVALPLATGELSEVEVTANAERSVAEINTINAEVSSTLSEREVEDIPIEGRDLTRALYRLPNVTQATGFYPEAPNVSINGANALFTNYLIDGMDNNENFLGGQKFRTPIGLVQNVTVLTSTYSAEYGRTGNGIFNVTTKSGSNDYAGEAFFLTRPGSIVDASNGLAQRDLSGNQVKDGFQRYQGGFAVGGPIKKDQTFFFVNVEHFTDLKDNLLNSPQLGVNETVRGVNNFTLTSAKLDHNWTNTFRSTLRANVGFVEVERQGGGLEGGVAFASAGNTQRRNSALVALNNTFLGKGYVVEGNLQYSRFRWNYADPENEDSPNVTVNGSDGGTIAVLGHPGYQFNDLENTFQGQLKSTIDLNPITLKVGTDVIVSDFQLAAGGNPNGSYSVQLTPAQEAALRDRALQVGSDLALTDVPADAQVTNFSIETRPATFGETQTQAAAYVETAFDATPQLNVSIGLRYDFDSLSKGGSDSYDLNNIAPRLSFNYQFAERNAIRGGYGIFYDKVVYALYSDALQQNSTSAVFQGQLQSLIAQGILPSDTDLGAVTFDGTAPFSLAGDDTPAYLQGPSPAEVQANGSFGDRRILSPFGYDNPTTHQFSLGFQRQLDSDRLFYVDLVHTRGYDLFRLRNLNAAAAFCHYGRAGGQRAANPADLVRSPAEADATRPTGFDGQGNQTAGTARNIFITESAGRSEYYGASVNLNKARGADDYRLPPELHAEPSGERHRRHQLPRPGR